MNETRKEAAAADRKQAASAASAVPGGASDLSAWPAPVRSCHTNLGFPLEQCVEAYSIFGQQQDVSEQIVIANMTGYLLNEQERQLQLARVNGFGAVGSPPASASPANGDTDGVDPSLRRS